MDVRSSTAGNGGPGKGLIDVRSLSEGCVVFEANPQHPPSAAELPLALAEVLQKWMLEQPVRVRETLPIVQNGSMVSLFVWWDRPGP